MVTRDIGDGQRGRGVESWFSISVVEKASNNSDMSFMNHYICYLDPFAERT